MVILATRIESVLIANASVLLRVAAEEGHPRSRFILALILALQNLDADNQAEAHDLLALAADQGHSEALLCQKALEEDKKVFLEDLEAVAKSLDADADDGQTAASFFMSALKDDAKSWPRPPFVLGLGEPKDPGHLEPNDEAEEELTFFDPRYGPPPKVDLDESDLDESKPKNQDSGRPGKPTLH
ncbi:MAG: hypothetical protein LBT38_12180 [Deltaproteobacteria bacterium]|jgi:hypothetical protein|nr:hypothetical protein [Deltaproteobacteria bacterium]